MVAQFDLTLWGKPEAKARHRHGQGRAYPDKAQITAENDIRRVWEERGRPHLEGPISVKLVLAVARPKDHFTTKGALSAKGKRTPHPHQTRAVDVDNALKNWLDALNSRAWADDKQIVDAHVTRIWADDRPYAYLLARALE